jgi:hypothetical protein
MGRSCPERCRKALRCAEAHNTTSEPWSSSRRGDRARPKGPTAGVVFGAVTTLVAFTMRSGVVGLASRVTNLLGAINPRSSKPAVGWSSYFPSQHTLKNPCQPRGRLSD